MREMSLSLKGLCYRIVLVVNYCQLVIITIIGTLYPFHYRKLPTCMVLFQDYPSFLGPAVSTEAKA